MAHHFPATAKTVRATLLCAALVPLVALAAGCDAKSSGSTGTNTAAAGAGTAAAGTAHASTSAAPATAAATTAQAAGSSPGSCPSAAAVTAAAGTTYPAPKAESGGGETSCSYSDPSTGANLTIGISAATGMSASLVQTTLDDQATSTGGKAQPVSGIGTAAYLLTENDANTNSSGVATSLVGAITSTRFVIVVGELSPAGVEAVTRLVLSE